MKVQAPDSVSAKVQLNRDPTREKQQQSASAVVTAKLGS